MKAIALGKRLSNVLGVSSFTELDADKRLEVLDAINGALQKLHAVTSHQSKTVTGSFMLNAPAAVTLGLTQGSNAVTGHTFAADDFYKTIRILGDNADNQIIGETELLHPYTGATGNIPAVIYSDAVVIPEPYEEMVGNPRVLETGRELVPFKLPPEAMWGHSRAISEPIYYNVESNARNQNPPAPAVIRVDALPDSAYRFSVEFTISPGRVRFGDLLAPGGELPLREEHIESYLLPVAKGLLAESDSWASDTTRSIALKKAEKAEADYEALIPRTLSTPRNIVRTRPGF